jgi:carboxyl-terminal processing protease
MIRFLFTAFIFFSLGAKEPPRLKVHDVSHRMEEMLRAHAQVHEVNNEILERTLYHFIEEMDRTKSYFLDHEVSPLIKLDENGLNTLKNAIRRGDFQYFSHLVQLFKKAVKRHNTLLLNSKLSGLTPKKLESKEELFAPSEESLLEKLCQLKAHTLFMAEFMIHFQQRLYGIGAMLRDDFDGLIVLKLIEGGPAARSGKVQVDDKIIAVNGEPVMGLSIQDAVSLIRGEKGTAVTLTLLRKDEHFTVPVIREEVIVEESRYSYDVIDSPDGAILHFALHSFYEDENTSSSKDFKKIYDSVKKQKPVFGVILDLRENSGGLMSQAVEIAGHFIHRGVVASVCDRVHGVYHMRNFQSPPTFRGPLVVMIDKASASSSEIVAQCLKDYGRAVLVGDNSSFGKGSYQVLSIDNQGSIDPKGEYRITRGLYYTVSGNSPQLTGVTPHVEIPGPLNKMEIGEKHHKFALPSNSIPASYVDQMLDLNPISRMRAKRGQQQQRLFIPDKILGFLNKASKERQLKWKKGENISYEDEKKLVLGEAVEVLKHWGKFKESSLLY